MKQHAIIGLAAAWLVLCCVIEEIHLWPQVSRLHLLYNMYSKCTMPFNLNIGKYMFSWWRKQTQFFLCLFFLSYDVHNTYHSLVLYLEQQLNVFEMDYRRALMFITPNLPRWNRPTFTFCKTTEVSALKWTDVSLRLLHHSYGTKMDEDALIFIKSKLPHWNGQTSTCVYYRKVTALKCTNENFCLLHQSYCTEMDWRPLVFITPKLPH